MGLCMLAAVSLATAGASSVREASLPSLAAVMRKSQEVKRLRFAGSTISAIGFRITAKLDDSCFIDMRLQAKPVPIARAVVPETAPLHIDAGSAGVSTNPLLLAAANRSQTTLWTVPSVQQVPLEGCL
jgi:hypothetical protein